MTNWLLRSFVKNSEDLESPKVRSRVGVLAGVTGIVCNLLMFLGKLLVGIMTASVSITADALNNLSDATSSVVTMLGFWLGSRPADDDHPYGHARYEYLAGLAVSALILVIGVELGKSSLEKIFHPQAIRFGLVPALVLGVSILVKFWMSAFNHTLGQKIHSETLEATAADSRNDVIMMLSYLWAIV